MNENTEYQNLGDAGNSAERGINSLLKMIQSLKSMTKLRFHTKKAEKEEQRKQKISRRAKKNKYQSR